MFKSFTHQHLPFNIPKQSMCARVGWAVRGHILLSEGSEGIRTKSKTTFGVPQALPQAREERITLATLPFPSQPLSWVGAGQSWNFGDAARPWTGPQQQQQGSSALGAEGNLPEGKQRAGKRRGRRGAAGVLPGCSLEARGQEGRGRGRGLRVGGAGAQGAGGSGGARGGVRPVGVAVRRPPVGISVGRAAGSRDAGLRAASSIPTATRSPPKVPRTPRFVVSRHRRRPTGASTARAALAFLLYVSPAWAGRLFCPLSPSSPSHGREHGATGRMGAWLLAGLSPTPKAWERLTWTRKAAARKSRVVGAGGNLRQLPSWGCLPQVRELGGSVRPNPIHLLLGKVPFPNYCTNQSLTYEM